MKRKKVAEPTIEVTVPYFINLLNRVSLRKLMKYGLPYLHFSKKKSSQPYSPEYEDIY